MDRRDFLKFSASILAALALPIPKGNDMEFSRLLEKIGRGQRLSENEISELRNYGRDLEEIKILAKSWVNAGTSTPIFQSSMDLIYSTILNQDTPSLTIAIPNTYNHLMIFGAGRTNGVGTNSQYLAVRFNGDSGSNYINQFFTAVAAVLTGTRQTGQNRGIVGVLAEGGRTAGDVGSFYAFLPHYNNSTLNKNIMSNMTLPFGSIINTASNWDTLAPISSLTFFSAADDIEAGSILSIYGVK
jgi:hypothetical protein